MIETPSRRPMTFTFLELLDRTFRLYRDNFITIIGVVAIVTIPMTILSLLLNPVSYALLTNQYSYPTTNLGTQLLLALLAIVQTVLIFAPIIYIASEYLFNHKVSIGEAFSDIRHRFVKMGCGMIVFSIFTGVVAVLIGFLVAVTPLLLALFGILIYIIISAYAVFFQVLALEDIGAGTAVTRAYLLGKRRFWTVVGLGLVLIIINAIVGAIFGGSVTFLVLSTAPGQSSSVQFLLLTFLNTLINIFLTPIFPIAFTLLYYDIRTRTEGLDIMLDSDENPAARPADFHSPDSRFSTDGHDWRNIAILTGIGLVAALVANSFITNLVEQMTRTLR
ncbi:MAG: hypothetical protein H6672_06365 [Anaerolineaceae bacterium]|nr:hypothetical protein [Anaerolineaceae bacterium]